MINQKKSIKKPALGALLCAGFIFTTVACTTEEKAKGFKDALIYVANEQFKSINNIDDDKEYITGISSCLWHVHNESQTLQYVAYNDDYAIFTTLTYKFIDDTDKDMTTVINNVKDGKMNVFAPRSTVGTRYKNDDAKNKFFEKYVITDVNADVDKMMIAKDPMKFVAYVCDDNPDRVYISYTSQNVLGDYVSLQGDKYSISRDDITGLGASNIYKKDKDKSFHYFLANYVAK